MLVVADWSNADFRAAAGLAQELIDGEKKDPYTLIGKLILDKSEITAEERDELKNTILAVMYGYEGREHADLFFKAYPKIAEFKKWVINEARLKRKLTTRYGKTRYFPALDKFETKAFNTINQMTVADLCKKAIVETQRLFKERGLKSTPIPYVCYDSFGFDLYLSERDEAIKAIREALVERTIPPAFRQYCDWEVKIKNCAGEVIE
jgi:DNA polymerase I-like protein with 3'-5' exonuclease and polymerase domains